LQIAYTGLSLTVPERVRFRYKLDGLDQDWTEAGTRRYVDYVNLPPRKYSFHVLACNNEGVWNTVGARLAFQIEPAFYQAKWFAPLCVAAAGLFVWGAYRLRVRRLVSRFQLVAQERARMTRELHDSLLQGFSGVVYQLEAASRLYDSNPEVSKRRLERAIDRADQSLREARRAIMSMHLPEIEDTTLPEALSAAGARAIEGSSIAFHLAVKGHVRQLPYEVQANVYLVGREAIANAVNHAGAKKIAAQLVYSATSVALSVQDDGTGFDLEAAMAKKDHRGVIGMHERAKYIGATLRVQTARGQGARIELVAPLRT
jgi:signal transduction histidine kinase